jgi:hypothetical protein
MLVSRQWSYTLLLIENENEESGGNSPPPIESCGNSPQPIERIDVTLTLPPSTITLLRNVR